MARPPKPTAVLRATGQFRPDRHADRLELSGNAPTKPCELPPEASRLWDSVTQTLPTGVLVDFDFALLEVACRWFARWKSLETRLDTGQEAEAKLIPLSASAARQYLAAAAKLGLTPTDRARLQSPTTESQEDPLQILQRWG